MLNIALLDDASVEAAGALLAREHKAIRRLHPGLPSSYGTPAASTAALQQLRRTGHKGAVVVANGRVVAIMTGIAHGTYARLPAEGFAVEPDLRDPTSVLARLYSELAPQFVVAGALMHSLDHVALPPLDSALANLAFGRHHVYATQRVAARACRAEVQIRIAGCEDLETIARFAQVEIRHRATPPIYAEPDYRSLDDIVAKHRTLQDHGAIHFIATLDGRDAGMLTIELASPAPRLCAEGQPYIGPTATHPDLRGRGVGCALVAAALTWAHSRGYRWLSVDFDPANPLSRPFWLSTGFQPVGYGVLRAIHSAYQRTA